MDCKKLLVFFCFCFFVQHIRFCILSLYIYINTESGLVYILKYNFLLEALGNWYSILLNSNNTGTSITALARCMYSLLAVIFTSILWCSDKVSTRLMNRKNDRTDSAI